MSDYGSFQPILQEAMETLGNVLYPGCDGDSPEGTPNTLLSFCRVASKEITQLRAALDESVAMNASYRLCLETLAHPSEIKSSWELRLIANDALKSQDPSAKSLLRDREIADAARAKLQEDKNHDWASFWQLVRDSMTNQPATPDVVTGGDGDPK